MKRVPAMLGTLCLSFYLCAGACVAFATGKWPVFVPPQFDMVEQLFSSLGHQRDAYVGGAILGICGLALAVLSLIYLIGTPVPGED